jgi:hypothetical protein
MIFSVEVILKLETAYKPDFWDDTWLGDTPLAQQYPLLCNVVQDKDVSVAHVLSNNQLNIVFKRTLTDN